jgi:17beta-estradiol 17-dehydrogenase / very-long-chain 3-oxoacyl-CoA reductase
MTILQLAKRGLNIILISRTLSKLETVAKEIRETFNVDTAVIDVDFTSGPAIYEKIKDKVKGKEIGILVNNVGMCYSSPDFLLSVPNGEKLFQDLIACNITSVPMMCSIIMPQMVQRKRGLVINISSISAIIPTALLTVYSASKAFVDKFSQDLASEYEKDGIIVQSILPGYVATNMSGIKQGSLNAPLPNEFVESALSKVGFTDCTTGYIPHSLFQFVAQSLNFVAPSVSRSITLKIMSGIHERHVKEGSYGTK